MNKVCLFNTTISWGGGEKWHFEVASKLFDEGYDIVVVAHKKSVLYRKLQATKVPCKCISASNLSFLNPIKIFRIFKLLRNEHINTVIFNLSRDVKVGGIAAKLAHIPNIIYRRGSAIPLKDSIFNRFIFSKIINNIIANSEETKRTINQNNPNLFPTSKIVTIYNGLDINQYDLNATPIYKKVNNEFIIGNLGRLVEQKNQKCLVDVAVRLKDKIGNFKFLIGGDGPLKSEIEQYATSKNVRDCFVFAGFIENPSAFMNAINIFVLSSKWEGFGFVLAEAMLFKKPIVAFDISSNNELVVEGETGYLVPPYDTELFAQRIAELYNSVDNMHILGDNGHKRVHNEFTIERTILNVKQYLKELPQ